MFYKGVNQCAEMCRHTNVITIMYYFHPEYIQSVEKAGLAYFREAWHNEEKTAGTAQPVWYSGYADVMKFRVDLTVRSFFDQIVQRSCIERHASIFPGSKTNH